MSFDFYQFYRMSKKGITEKDVELKCIEMNDKVHELNQFEEELDERERYIKEWAIETAEKALENANLQVRYNNLETEVEALETRKANLLKSISSLQRKEEQLKLSIDNIDDFKIFNTQNKIDEIDTLSGHEFEEYCARILQSIGFSKVSVTSGSGDQGIDVLASYEETKYGFQCKKYSKIVGNKAVQEVLSGKSFYKLDRVGVITNNFFTTSAKELAKQGNVELWDRNTLKRVLEELEQ